MTQRLKRRRDVVLEELAVGVGQHRRLADPRAQRRPLAFQVIGVDVLTGGSSVGAVGRRRWRDVCAAPAHSPTVSPPPRSLHSPIRRYHRSVASVTTAATAHRMANEVACHR